MRFGLLGTVLVRRGSELAPVRWPMPRAVLTALLLNANRVVTTDRLVDVVWGDASPPSAMASLQNHVMRLRTLLADAGAGQIKTVAPGYVIEVADGDLDVHEFARLYRSGREALAAGDWVTASREITSALGLWRGDPFEDVTSVALRERAATQLTQMRLEALESRIEAELRQDHHQELIAELTGLVASHPLRERFHAQLMRAHYHAGQQGEALAAYRRVRGFLTTELGIEPGPELQALHQRMLAGNLKPAASRSRRNLAPAQLPADLADFTGRNDQVAMLAEAAGTAVSHSGVVPLCVVTGPGGIGKTTLAVHASHEIKDRFPDGQLYARLWAPGSRPIPPGQVLGRFLRSLGAGPEQIPAESLERAATFRSMLSGRRVLIVLDDAWDACQVRSLLPGTAGCAVMITSRNPLADLPGARRFRLAALSHDQALELLARIVGAERLRAEADAARRIADLCAGLPLALRIAGSRLATRPQWRVDDLATRLADAAARLDELTVGDLSVRTTFAVSYASLPDDLTGKKSAHAFRLLGLWAGPDFSSEAAAALLGVDVMTAENVLGTLLDKHLLEEADSPGRYRFPNLLGIYAAERGRDEEPQDEIHASLERLLGWFLHSTDAVRRAIVPEARPLSLGPLPEGVQPWAPRSPAHAARWLNAEFTNLRVAMRAAASRKDYETTRQLAAALRALPAHGRNEGQVAACSARP